ncbi:MAG: TIGR04086 family membrane protein [Clostridia bacterium]|jgi:putative membrane protein (TIGR04086 family)|nr:putative membrane protein TIGR04086 family/integral membrane protein TIGR04097 family [Clostridium sp. CAG:571]HJJ06183.1 TIGR04086 family membrane protein [Clostridiaceae bacterium]HJJ14366.1 TIGR04086 family membrane protein [Clostridiaceae bacterium]
MEKNVSINKINLNNNIVKVIKGSIIAFLISIMLLFIFASLLVYTNIQENTIKPVVIIISIISILVGSSLSSIKIKRKGIVNGALVGTIYIMVIYILSSICFVGFELNLESIIMIISSIISGMIGGVIGVNIDSKK